MASTSEIRRALGALLTGLPGDVAVRTGQTSYQQPGEAFDTRGFLVRVLLGHDDEPNREALDALLDPEGGLKALLDADDTLGGLVADVRVVKSSGHQLYETEDGHRLGAEWSINTLT